MRKKLIAGNWKMNGTLQSAQHLIAQIVLGLSRSEQSCHPERSEGSRDHREILRYAQDDNFISDVRWHDQCDVLVIPAFVHLTTVKTQIGAAPIALGAQNLYLGDNGAFTGEVSGAMLKDSGCQYVLVGHSERRTLFHEDLELVACKFKAAIRAGLIPILCVGESKSEREQNMTETVIAKQLNSVIEEVGLESFERAVIAYEPVWAIGTGLTATPEQAEAVHLFIRSLIQKNNIY